MKRALSQFNMFETYKPMSGDKVNLVGSVEREFDEKFDRLFAIAILTNNKDILSKEQEQFINLYFKEADDVMSTKIAQFDKFLGGL
mgnify:CR=1 FL=1